MHLQPVIVIQATIFVLLWIDAPIAQGKKSSSTPRCPIGYSIFSTKDKTREYCFRRKGPEKFADKYKDCVGNLYTSKLYRDMNLTKPDYVVWTEYKSMHPGGHFVDWSYTKSIGDKFDTVYDVMIDPSLDLEEELCLVIDPVSNYTAVKCNEMHYSFCVVRVYDDDYKDHMKNEDCAGLKDSLRFRSPESTCLSVLSGVGGGAVRATWHQAQELCMKKGGSLLNHGWRFSNYPKFQSVGINHTYPLGIVMTDDLLLRYDTMTDHSEIPLDEWNLRDSLGDEDNPFGSIYNGFWDFVNSTYIFYDVICEHSVPLKDLTMDVAIDSENKLTLTINDTLDGDDIYCFTDSVDRYQVKVSKNRIDDTNVFVLKPKDNGYYWCTHINAKKYNVKESKKVLFIREKQSLINVYAVKLKNNKLYKVDDLSHLYKTWKTKLIDYIFYRTKYVKVYGGINSNITEEDLQGFKNYAPIPNEKSVILKMNLKRLYMDRRSVLVHVDLNPEMMPVTPGFWDQMEVVSMKPVYYCKAFDTVPQTPLGESYISNGCRTHTCVGNFNEGVQWVTTATENCSLLPRSYVEEVTVIMPTLPAPLPTFPTLESIRDASDSSEEKTESTTPSTTITTDTYTDYSSLGSERTLQETSTLGEEVITAPFPIQDPTSTESGPLNQTTTTDLPFTTTTMRTSTTVMTSTTTRRPEEQLQQVIDDLGQLVNSTATILVDDITDVFNQADTALVTVNEATPSVRKFYGGRPCNEKNRQETRQGLFFSPCHISYRVVKSKNDFDLIYKVDNILEVQDSLSIPGRLLHLLDRLGSTVQLNGSNTGATIRGNIALLMADANPDQPIRGLRIATRNTDVFTSDAFEIISNELNSTDLDSERSEVVVNLPQSVSVSSQRISFVVFRNDRAFQPEEGYSVNSRVLSIRVGDVRHFENGEFIDIHLSPTTSEPNRNQSRTCAYWVFRDDGTGYWSQDGCTLIRATEPGMLDTCRCNHLTHFAEVLFPRNVFSQGDEDALELLTIIGCCLSIIGLFLVGITAATFRSWRRDFSNKIWFQLCISIFFLALSFLIVIFAKFTQYNVFCMLMGIVLHYSVLSSFCWMLVAAVLSYRRLVLVFTRDASHKLLRASAFSWGAPCAVIGILLSVNPHSYAGRFEETSPSASFCYPSGLGLWLAVYGPIAGILIVNWTLFALIVRSVFASRGIQRHGDTNEALRCASVSCLLVFLFGLPWVFGLFAFNVVAAYLFTLTATFQGFMLFLFFVLGNKKTRDLWLNKLKIKQTRKVPVTSSTYSNRSTGWRGGTQGASIEAKVSKPKSLAQDDSRFS